MNLEQQRVGDYVLGERVGEDGSGTLHRARHATRNTDVMVLVLRAQDPAVKTRFLAEAASLRELEHAGIARVIDHGESPHGLFVVMESVAGESLTARLARDKRLPLEDTRAIVGATASALAAAHRARVTHRALDAGSVFVDANGAVKVVGLGLAKLVNQDGGKEVDQRADIRALGRLAYEMLAGQAPVVSPPAQPGASSTVTKLATLGVTVPANVEAAIAKAIAGKKKRRFSSMADFAQAFGAPFTAPPAPAAPLAEIIDPSPIIIAQTALRSTPVKPPPLPPGARRRSRITTLAGAVGAVVTPVRELGKRATPRQLATAGGGVVAAAAIIVWLSVRSGGPSEPVVTDVKPPIARVVEKPVPAPTPAPSRVDDILALNQKAVSAYAHADVKTARTLLEEADALAVSSGYQQGMVRAQTQVRLGALWMAKNPRVGRRFFAQAVAINPAVKLPAEMTTPKVKRALAQARAKASGHVASGRVHKRATAGKAATRRHGREAKRARTR